VAETEEAEGRDRREEAEGRGGRRSRRLCRQRNTGRERERGYTGRIVRIRRGCARMLAPLRSVLGTFTIGPRNKP
jgi:hypothetical protein